MNVQHYRREITVARQHLSDLVEFIASGIEQVNRRTRLQSHDPTAWVQWVIQQPDVIAQEILGSEFQWVSRENDVLVKVASPTQSPGIAAVAKRSAIGGVGIVAGIFC